MMKTIRFLLTLIIIYAFTFASAQSQVINSYRSIQSGNWNTAGTWQRFDGNNWIAATAVPSSADEDITIRNGHTVTISDTRTIDQTVVEAGGSLVLTGTLNVADGSGDDLTINGTMSWNSGNLSGPGNIFISDNGILNLATGAGKVFSTSPGVVNNNGTINWNDGAIFFNSGFTINNAGDFNVSSVSSILNNGATGTFNNSGTVTKTGTGNTTFNISFNNLEGAEFDFNGGTITNQGTFTSSGNMVFDGGIFTNTATMTILANSTVVGTGTINQTSGILAVNTSIGIPSTVTLNLNGILAVAADQTLTINGTWNWNSGEVRGPGTLAINEGGTFNLATGAGKVFSTSPGVVNNNGTINWNAGPVFFISAFTINNAGNFNISSTSSIFNNGATGTIDNSGTVTKTGAGNTTFNINFNNLEGGDFAFNGGTIINQGIFINSGNMVFDSGIFATSGTMTHLTNSTISGTGIFNQTGGIQTVNGSTTLGSTVTLNQSGILVVASDQTLTVNGTWT